MQKDASMTKTSVGSTAGVIARVLAVIVALAMMSSSLQAQEQTPPSQTESNAAIALTLRHAIELALQNSREIQVARLQASLANRSALITKSQFLPNLYAGSGAGFTYGIPETPGGRAPSLFNTTYTEQIFNPPLRGQGKELEEQAKSQKILLDDTRNRVIVNTAAAYLELGMVRHSLEVLRKEQDSAEKILGVTQQREKENLELPVNVTKDQLMRARITQRILQLEGREDELQVYLRSQTGLAPETPIDVSPEDLPRTAEQEGANLVAMAMQNSPSLRAAESDVRAKEFRLKGEKRGNLPTLEFVAIYSRLANFNNYTQFFKTFQPNNVNAGVQIQVPLFSSQTRANIALAQVNLDVAKATLADKRNQVSAEMRQKTRTVRERDAAKEVARLELQLAQQNVSVLQSLFQEGKVNLREVERARLEENEKWMGYLDANFQRQQAQLDLLKAAGQLDKVWQ
jgi:outer membrane protein